MELTNYFFNILLEMKALEQQEIKLGSLSKKTEILR
jgi:hypothetical protein